MGSTLLRTYLGTYGTHVEKAVLIDSYNVAKSYILTGYILARILQFIKGRHRSRLLENMASRPFNIPFKPVRTEFDWLSQDNSAVDSYITDPLCGYAYTPKFYIELVKGASMAVKRKTINKTPDIPILFLLGSRDSVGNMGADVVETERMYKTAGYTTSLIFMGDTRHDMFNEFDKDFANNSILHFLEN